MLEQLMNLVRQQAGDPIINNPAIPNEKNEEAVSDASASIMAGLKGAVANGNVDGVLDLLKEEHNLPEILPLHKIYKVDMPRT